MESGVRGSTAPPSLACALPFAKVVHGVRNEGFRPTRAQVRGPSLRLKIVLLVAFAALAPALLVGVASYITVERHRAEELVRRLGERTTTAERQLSRFLGERHAAGRTLARSRALAEALAAARSEPEGDRLGRLLSGIRRHDRTWEGLAVFDGEGALVSATEPTGLWSAEAAPTRASSSAPRPILGTGPRALLVARYVIPAAGERRGGYLQTASRLDPLWRALSADHEGTPTRLRVVDARSQVLFDSESHPGAPEAPLPVAAAERLFELRVGHADYANEAGVDVIAAHRFEPASGLGALVELPADLVAEEGARWQAGAVEGSLATVVLLAIICSLLALYLTGPLRGLVRDLEKLGSSLSQRLAIRSADEIGAIRVAFNQRLDALEKSTRQLERLSSTDELTGLHNRRNLDRMFEVELNRANRTRQPLSVLMIDLDHFMAFNERHGRAQGDAFLQHVASFLKTWLRTTDVVARYGGEEFAALLPDTERRTAIEIAERLRVRFAETQPPSSGARSSVTLSIGVSTWAVGAAIQTDLLGAASRGMREAKRNGRNQVRFAA